MAVCQWYNGSSLFLILKLKGGVYMITKIRKMLSRIETKRSKVNKEDEKFIDDELEKVYSRLKDVFSIARYIVKYNYLDKKEE